MTEQRFALTRSQMRELDRLALERCNIPVELLMENAGEAVAWGTIQLIRSLKLANPWKVVVLCGSGNNAGDGLVAARVLKRKGVKAKAVFLKPTASLKGAARLNFQRLKRCGIPWAEQPALNRLEGDLEGATAVVDALLGTGFKGRMDPALGQAVEKVRQCGKPVVAVDIPSGLEADSGMAEGPAIRADLTVTMGALKKGFLNPAARRWTGDIIVADIGFPEQLLLSVMRGSN